MKKFLAPFFALFIATAGFAQDTNSQSEPVKNTAIIPATRSNPTNWMARHEGFVKEAQAGHVDILFMGDSITDGWRGKGKNVWDKFYAPKYAANFGIGGDRTEHVLWRIENGELVGIDPKVVVLMIGTNNSGANSADQISEGVEKIVADFRTQLPKSKILLLAIFPRGKPDANPKQMDTIRAVNQRIAKLDDGKMITYLDIGKAFLGDDGQLHAEVMPDFLHPNEHGYELWAAAMNPTLDKMLQ